MMLSGLSILQWTAPIDPVIKSDGSVRNCLHITPHFSCFLKNAFVCYLKYFKAILTAGCALHSCNAVSTPDVDSKGC